MKETRVTLVANGNGAQPFFGGDFLNDSQCPLTQGEDVTAEAIPGVGVLLTPVHDHTDYRIEPVADDQHHEVTPDV